MSSILEALKELESDRARASKKTTSVVDSPGESPRSLGAFIPLTGGLAIGVVAFGFYLWSSGWMASRPSDPPAPPAPPDVSAPAPPAQAPPAPTLPRGPDWLARAEAPRARVAPLPAASAPPPPPSAPAAAVEASAPTVAPPAVAKTSPRAERGNGDQQVRVEAVSYSAHVDQRTATLLVNGRRATLHERESLGGVEVQLIMADGVYLQRGSDVFFVASPR